MKSSTLFSIVSPVYLAENIIEELVKRLKKNTSIISEEYEVILVNDSSPDNSWNVIKRECDKDKRVKGIKLSRNFGQHYALSAGLKYAKGDWVIVIDCDLQDNPEEIPNLYKKALEGYEIVYTSREDRRDSVLKKLSSSLFHSVFKFLSGGKTDKNISNYGIYKKNVVEEFNKVGDYYRSFYSIMNSLGFNKCIINVAHNNRYEGKSSYSFSKLLKLSTDIIISNTNKPLYLSIKMGIGMTLISIFFICYNLFLYFRGNVNVAGFTSTIISIWLIGGLNLFMMGVIGVYIGRIYDQVKGRPLFIVEEEVNI